MSCSPSSNALAFLTCVFLSVFLLLSESTLSARPKNIQELSSIASDLLVTKIEYGAIPSLYRPRFESVKSADLNMTKESIVFVVMMPDGPRIYPQSIMVWHQVVNELIDDHAYVVTYCPTTGTLMAYDAGMNGLNLIFDADGRLYDGNTVLVDRNSGSLWLQELGMAFEGPLLGRGMPTLPVFWTTWAAARKVYPDARVMINPPGNRPYGHDPYGNYLKKGTYYDNDILIYPLKRMDRRFHRKTPMLCLEINGVLLGIDIAYIKKNGAVNFFLGPLALLAVHDAQLDVVRVFERNIWADPFLFVKQYGKLLDLNTKSVWSASSGQAIDGNMKGAQLKQHFGGYSMWLAWYSLNPETFVIPGPGEVPAKLLSIHQPGIEEKVGILVPQETTPSIKAPVSPQTQAPNVQGESSMPPSAPTIPQQPSVAKPSSITVPASPRAPVLPTSAVDSKMSPQKNIDGNIGLAVPLPKLDNLKNSEKKTPNSAAPLPDFLPSPNINTLPNMR